MITVKVDSNDFDFKELKYELESKSIAKVHMSQERSFLGSIMIDIDIDTIINLGTLVVSIIALLKDDGKSETFINNYNLTIVNEYGDAEKCRIKDIEDYGKGLPIKTIIDKAVDNVKHYLENNRIIGLDFEIVDIGIFPYSDIRNRIIRIPKQVVTYLVFQLSEKYACLSLLMMCDAYMKFPNKMDAEKYFAHCKRYYKEKDDAFNTFDDDTEVRVLFQLMFMIYHEVGHCLFAQMTEHEKEEINSQITDWIKEEFVKPNKFDAVAYLKDCGISVSNESIGLVEYANDLGLFDDFDDSDVFKPYFQNSLRNWIKMVEENQLNLSEDCYADSIATEMIMDSFTKNGNTLLCIMHAIKDVEVGAALCDLFMKYLEVNYFQYPNEIISDHSANETYVTMSCLIRIQMIMDKLSDSINLEKLNADDIFDIKDLSEMIKQCIGVVTNNQIEWLGDMKYVKKGRLSKDKLKELYIEIQKQAAMTIGLNF